MSSGFCTVCGAVLRDGVCPNGHPQRVERHRRHGRKRRYRGLLVFLLVFLVVSGAIYAGLAWYPERAASQLTEPSSREFSEALGDYRATVSVFPPGPTDPQPLVAAANSVLASSGAARDRIARASVELEGREPPELPVVASRPPLLQAREARDLMLAFYTRALEVLGRLEAVSGYVTQAAAVLPQLDTLSSALGNPKEAAEIRAAVAASTPVADQMVADLRALTPPNELGGLHTSLRAIARRIRADLDEMDRTAQEGATPVAAALLEDIRDTLDTFRQTLGTAPREASKAGLAADRQQVEALAQQIIGELRALRDVHGLSDVTVPER